MRRGRAAAALLLLMCAIAGTDARKQRRGAARLGSPGQHLGWLAAALRAAPASLTAHRTHAASCQLARKQPAAARAARNMVQLLAGC
jgi:hypothetical protein